eukprot:s1836_g11.t1
MCEFQEQKVTKIEHSKAKMSERDCDAEWWETILRGLISTLPLRETLQNFEKLLEVLRKLGHPDVWSSSSSKFLRVQITATEIGHSYASC